MISLPRTLPVIIIAAGALFLSAAGGAVAGGMITGAQIKNGTVTTKDIKNSTLKLADISSAAKAALQGQTGPAGPTGPSGADGATGPAGAAGPAGPAGPAGTNGSNGTNGTDGVSGYETITAAVAVAGNAQGLVSQNCPAGKKLLGATADFASSFLGTGINSTSTSATAYGKNTNPGGDVLRLEIHCASAL
jgi:hypothetical protein